MKIALPSHNNYVDDHFGHCSYYTIYSIGADSKIDDEELFEAPRGCGCKSNIAAILKNKGIEVLLAGNMGQGAVEKISAAGIKVYRGCYGEVRKVAESFLRNELVDSGTSCKHHHRQGKQCEHE